MISASFLPSTGEVVKCSSSLSKRRSSRDLALMAKRQGSDFGMLALKVTCYIAPVNMAKNSFKESILLIHLHVTTARIDTMRPPTLAVNGYNHISVGPHELCIIVNLYKASI